MAANAAMVNFILNGLFWGGVRGAVRVGREGAILENENGVSEAKRARRTVLALGAGQSRRERDLLQDLSEVFRTSLPWEPSPTLSVFDTGVSRPISPIHSKTIHCIIHHTTIHHHHSSPCSRASSPQLPPAPPRATWS
jgi:hypothetical protein